MELDKDYNLIVGLRIREIRETLQMTRAAFSEKCDLSESFLAAVESGRKGITSKTVYKICSSANISANYLIFGNDNGFEIDTVIELIKSLDKKSRESAVRILQEYAYAIRNSQNSNHNKK